MAAGHISRRGWMVPGKRRCQLYKYKYLPTYQAFIPCAEKFKGYHNLLHTPRKVQWLPKHLIKIVWAGEWSREAARDCRQTNILRGCLPANPPASRPLINEIIIKKKPKKRRHANILKAYPPENLPTLWAGDRSTLNRVFLRRAFMPFFASHTYT